MKERERKGWGGKKVIYENWGLLGKKRNNVKYWSVDKDNRINNKKR